MAYNTIYAVSRDLKKHKPRMSFAAQRPQLKGPVKPQAIRQLQARRRQRRQDVRHKRRRGAQGRAVFYGLALAVGVPWCLWSLFNENLKAGLTPVPVLVLVAFLFAMSLQDSSE